MYTVGGLLHGNLEVIASEQDRSFMRLGEWVIKKLLLNKDIHPDATLMALGAVVSLDAKERKIGGALFRHLLKNGSGERAALRAASECLKSDNTDIKVMGLELHQLLVRHCRGSYDRHISAAVACATPDEDLRVRIAAFKLFGTLVRRKKGYIEAETSAGEAMKSSCLELKMSALEVLAALSRKNEALDASASALRNFVTTVFPSAEQEVDSLFKEEGADTSTFIKVALEVYRGSCRRKEGTPNTARF